jgi:putative ABC transport system substrate-binding protein
MILRRRDFITLLGGAAAAWPLAARAQQAAKPRTIGVLGTGLPSWIAAFTQRLTELGWSEGRSVAILYRVTDGGSPERDSEIAAEFVRLNVDLIVTARVAAARRATSTIPIVFPMSQDPVGGGFVASLGRPGGNVTGLSAQQADLAGKRVEFLREVVPALRRLAVMGPVADVGIELEAAEVQAAARALGLDATMVDIRRAEDVAPAFEALRGSADALYVAASPVLNLNRSRVITWEHVARLPTMHGFREDVDAGALMSYGPSAPDMWRRTADIVDKILRGAKPADIPVQQPTKFELVFNLNTAKAIELNVPPTFLAIADEVIE